MTLLNFIGEYLFMAMYALTLVFAVLRFPRYFDTPLRYLPVLLAYTLLTEAIGILVRDNNEYSVIIRDMYYNNNWLIYNIYSLIFFGYFFYVYGRYLSGKKARLLLQAGIGLYGVACIGNALTDDFTIVSQVYAFTVGSILIMALSALYLWQQYRFTDREARSRNLLVWISRGILLFHLGYTPIKHLRALIAAETLPNLTWVRPLHLSLIVAMYACIMIGLIRMRKMKRPPAWKKGR